MSSQDFAIAFGGSIAWVSAGGTPTKAKIVAAGTALYSPHARVVGCTFAEAVQSDPQFIEAVVRREFTDSGYVPLHRTASRPDGCMCRSWGLVHGILRISKSRRRLSLSNRTRRDFDDGTRLAHDDRKRKFAPTVG
jgi:hypothetical protein